MNIIRTWAKLDPKNSLAPNTVRWLMGARKADRWETTQENAWAIMALTGARAVDVSSGVESAPGVKDPARIAAFLAAVAEAAAERGAARAAV